MNSHATVPLEIPQHRARLIAPSNDLQPVFRRDAPTDLLGASGGVFASGCGGLQTVLILVVHVEGEITVQKLPVEHGHTPRRCARDPGS